MKLRRLTVSGFRGAPHEVSLELKGKSCAVLGENGSGKSTLADAVAFWSEGDLENYHRAGCELPTAIHVDAPEASVLVEIDGFPPIRRTLTGKGASPLAAAGPVSSDRPLPQTIPHLRHTTITRFINRTAGEKRKELLKILGLDELNTFRDVLVTARNNARDAATNAENAAERERKELQTLAGGDPVEIAEQLRQEAGLSAEIADLEDLKELEVDLPRVQQQPNRLERADELARALASVPKSPSKTWNDLLADRQILEADVLATLLETGRRALTTWSESSCPLCLSPQDPDRLIADIEERAAKYAQAQQRLTEARRTLSEHEEALSRVASAIQQLQKVAPEDGWPAAEVLDRQRADIERYVAEARHARATASSCPEPPALEVEEVLGDLRTAAAAADASDPVEQARRRLASLREQAQRVDAAEQGVDIERLRAAAIDRLKAIAEDEIQRAIEKALDELSALAGKYYARLTSQAVYSDIRLKYKATAKGGQIEFHLVYDGRHPITPPQRIMSESQLNALGLALFLARLKIQKPNWRTLILDDVVNSFDGEHRLGLAHLLSEEFDDWQVIIFTHDRTFFEMFRNTRGWISKEIVEWTPRGGPTLVDGDPVDQLRELLAAGRQASQLGGLARRALEESLSRPLEKLRYPIRHDPHSRYGAKELLLALRRGLAEARSPLAGLPVLRRLEDEAYMSNLGAHYRPAAPALTRGDLQRLLDDLEELRQAFRCSECQKPVWTTVHKDGTHRCECLKLAA